MTASTGGVLAAILLLGSCARDRQRAVGDTAAGDVALADARPGAAPSNRAAEPAQRKVVVHGVDLTGVGHDWGSIDAPIVVVEFSDFGCPYCARHAQQTFPSLEREFVATGKVFYKYVPFVMGMFPNGTQAARAAECAGEQEKFREMHDMLFARQTEWKRSLSPFPILTRYASRMGLDDERFRACYVKNVSHHPRTGTANDRAERLGVRVTPSFVVDGRAVEGAVPLPQFRELLGALTQAK